MKVAIVCSWLNQYGGAERVLEAVHEMFPQAPIYTSIYEPKAMPQEYRSWDIRTSFLNRLPLIRRYHQPFLPLYPLAFEQFDLGEYDLVISVTSAFAHGVITPPKTLHICYCLTPTRFLWDYHDYVRREGVPSLVRALLPPFLNYLRLWDQVAADRVDHFVAISQAVQRRIEKYYRRESTIIHPPINTIAYEVAPAQEDYFLIVSRLVPYKRIDIAVRAFNKLGLPLVIVGDGRDRAPLEAMAKPNVVFLGHIPDGEIGEQLARCRALIFPGKEDFGLSALEAQAAGRPVIAYAGGGALETVVEGVTGAFFHEQTVEALTGAVERFKGEHYDPEAIRRHAEGFDVSVFKRKMGGLIEREYAAHRGEGDKLWN